MTTTNLRYFQLLQQTEKNPLAKKLAGAFDIADDFRRDCERIAADRRLSAEGRRDATQDLMKKAVRDLRDVRKPLDEFRAKTEAMKATVKRPAIDGTDVVGALNRQELRAAARTMTSGQRAGHMAGERRSTAFIDALLEFADDPWLCGIDVFNPNEMQVYEAAKLERLRDFHGPLLDTIAEREATEVEAGMIPAVARVDIQGASGLESKDFEALAKPVETKVGAPWLKRYTEQDGKEVIRVVDFEAPGGPVGRIATEDEKRDGQFFKDFAEYQAARVA